MSKYFSFFIVWFLWPSETITGFLVFSVLFLQYNEMLGRGAFKTVYDF